MQKNSCKDCNNSDILVLEFDHIDPTTKTMCISEMLRNGNSWDNILLEIQKCEVVCANCHRIRTYNRSGSWRLVI